METSDVTALRDLADLRGIELRHQDGFDREVEPGPDALAAVLAALEGTPLEVSEAPERLRAARATRASRVVEPVSVSWGDRVPVIRTGPGLPPGEQVEVRVRGEDGHRTETTARSEGGEVGLQEGLPAGYYEVEVARRGGGRGTGLLIVAPETAYPGGDGGTRDWGVFLPLYALRTERSRAMADLTDLGRLVDWAGERGGSVVGTLPLMAAYLDEPSDPSPYSPVSRLFWNEAYLDPTAVPEWETVSEARRLWESEAFRERVHRAREADEVDYREAARLQAAVLQPLADAWAGSGGEGDGAFASFLDENPEAGRYAAFRATVERRGETWQGWPQGWRRTGIPSDAYHEGARRRHLYAQFRFPSQLARAVARGGEGAGLYLDLPLGPHPGGYDPWAHPELYAADVGMGAPPDAFHAEGQSWGLPPMRPEAARQEGHRHLRQILGRLLPPSRYLRIDHVMGLHRSYWVPDGLSAAEGVYVRFPAEEAYAVLCLESHRHECVIVGEDLGTVPDQVRTEMERRDVRRMYVVPFEVEPESREGLAPVPPGAVAALNTHDLPTFAATWRDEDGAFRRGLRAAVGSHSARPEEDSLSDEAQALEDVLRWVGRGPAGLVLVNLEDLWLEERPQNVPGTADPGNWRRRARLSLEELADHPRVLACLEAVREARQGAEAPEMTSGT